MRTAVPHLDILYPSLAMSQASPATSADLDQLPPQLQQALHTLDLEPEQELKKFRQYKNGDVPDLMAEPERPAIATTEEEEEDEDYELIPPSEPFAARSTAEELELEPAPLQAPGELVLSSYLREDESLDLSYVSPGEITQVGDEYRPASQELWRSLGQPTPPVAPVPEAKWRLPVAIGSSVIALSAVAGMTYVNAHPELLQQIPVVAQLTAAPIPSPIPPGNLLQGPDLAMGEFSTLTLANLNGIAIPTNAAPIAEVPVTQSIATSAAPVMPALTPTAPIIPRTKPNTLPSTLAPSTAATTTTTSNTPSLADSLIRKLLPPNIQQLGGQSGITPVQPQIQTPAKAAENPKPYSPSKMLFQPNRAATEGFRVTTDYSGPVALAKILSLVPQAIVEGDRINLGTFKNKSQAQEIIKNLAQQGIKARLQ